MGVQHNFYSLFLPKAAQSTTRLTEAELRGAAATTQEQEEWVQLDNNLKYVLIITTVGAAATLCRQFQHEISKENTKEKEKENIKARKAKRATKEKVTEATVNTKRETTPHSQQKEKERLDKECLSKDNMTREKESPTASQQDKEKDKSFATNVDNQATQ